jgi:hypothetical protein
MKILSYAYHNQEDSEQLRLQQKNPQEAPKQLRRQKKMAPGWRVSSGHKKNVRLFHLQIPHQANSAAVENHGVYSSGHILSTIPFISGSLQ